MRTNVAAECMGSRCDQWARLATLLPAEPLVEDAAVAEPLIGSGLADGVFLLLMLRLCVNTGLHIKLFILSFDSFS